MIPWHQAIKRCSLFVVVALAAGFPLARGFATFADGMVAFDMSDIIEEMAITHQDDSS